MELKDFVVINENGNFYFFPELVVIPVLQFKDEPEVNATNVKLKDVVVCFEDGFFDNEEISEYNKTHIDFLEKYMKENYEYELIESYHNGDSFREYEEDSIY